MSQTELIFSKYQGTGNDFIMINSFHEQLPEINTPFIQYLCNRHLGIGADGLIILRKSEGFDFEMIYFNSDGREGTMCGNGGRAAVAYALHSGIIGKKMQVQFLASNGLHWAEINDFNKFSANISLGMQNTQLPHQLAPGNYFLNTGSPHLVIPVEDPQKTDVLSEGRKLRYSKLLEPDGANINFIAGFEKKVFVRTYERGVENETLSCGTGVTASAIVWAWMHSMKGHNEIDIDTNGGQLKVRFQIQRDTVTDIILSGPAVHVFTGSVQLKSLLI